MTTEDNTSDFSVRLIRLQDGTLIDPFTREPISASLHSKKDEKDEHDADSDDDSGDSSDIDDGDAGVNAVDTIIPTARRSIMDLGLGPQQMAFINNVLVYTLWGLPDDEIALQCNCNVHQVRVVRDLDDYKRMHDALIDGLREAYMSTVHGILQNAAPTAARRMVKNINNKSPDIAMTALKDVLDRTGHRPADRVEHTHNIGNGSELVIRVIRQDEANAVPTIDITPNA